MQLVTGIQTISPKQTETEMSIAIIYATPHYLCNTAEKYRNAQIKRSERNPKALAK